MPAPTQHTQPLRSFVSLVAGRLHSAHTLELACRGAFVGTACIFPYLLLLFVCGASRGALTSLAIVFPVAAAIITVSFFRGAPLSDYEAAKLADERLGMKDQLAAAYDFIRSGRDEPLAVMAIRQTTGKLSDPALAMRAVPVRIPNALWGFLGLAFLCLGAHSMLFPPKETLSDATRRELQAGKESLEGLLALEADISDDDQKQEFERIRKLIEELNLMSDTATKDEILARLSREIADLDAEGQKDDAMSRALDELKKYRDRVAMGDLMDELQEELDKGAEELAVVTQDGQKVTAEAIKTLALVEKQALAEERAKKGALAKELKEVAKEHREKDEGAAKEWDLAKKDQAGEGTKKELKKGQLSYDALSAAVEDRDIRTMILSAAADNTRSTDGYREVYHNYHRILESVLFQQRVPSGQQLYVRRYFKVIKPEE